MVRKVYGHNETQAILQLARNHSLYPIAAGQVQPEQSMNMGVDLHILRKTFSMIL